jgi:ribosomal protein S18 acetylase RimI-like enzyme
MTPRIVDLTPDLLDGAAGVHLDAFRGYMNASLGRGYARAFLLWFTQVPGGVALAALENGRVAGYAVGAPVGYDREMTRALIWVVARAFALRPWLLLQKRFLQRIARRARPVPHPPPEVGKVISLVGIGVAESGQGSGIGRLLMEEFERRARELGMTSMRLSVYADNERARRLYERVGWVVERSEPNALYYRRTL